MVDDEQWMRAWIAASLHTNRSGDLLPSPKLMPLVEALRVLESASATDPVRRDAFETIKGRISSYARFQLPLSSRWTADPAEFQEFLGWKEGGNEGESGPPQQHLLDKETGQPWTLHYGSASGSGRRSQGEGRFVAVSRPPLAVHDAEALITTVTVGGVTQRPLDKLKELVNPVNWVKAPLSPFRSSYRVEMRDDRPVYEPDGAPRRTVEQPTGSWRGILYEDVDLHWHGVPINGFRNLLNVGFEFLPDNENSEENEPVVLLEFDLYRALSSSFANVTRPGGVELDSGYTKVWRFDDAFLKSLKSGDPKLSLKGIVNDIVAPPLSEQGLWYVELSKTIRFSTLTPRTVTASKLNVGQVLNHLAPSVVTTWMDLAAAAWIFTSSNTR